MSVQGKRMNDEALLAGLVGGATVEQAAERAGISVRTAYRRLRNEDFLERLQSLRERLVERSADQLTSAASEALGAMLALVRDAAIPPEFRFKVAQTIVSLGMRAQSNVEDRKWDKSFNEDMAGSGSHTTTYTRTR